MGTADLSPSESWLKNTLFTLKRFPLDLIDWLMSNESPRYGSAPTIYWRGPGPGHIGKGRLPCRRLHLPHRRKPCPSSQPRCLGTNPKSRWHAPDDRRILPASLLHGLRPRFYWGIDVCVRSVKHVWQSGLDRREPQRGKWMDLNTSSAFNTIGKKCSNSSEGVCPILATKQDKRKISCANVDTLA